MRFELVGPLKIALLVLTLLFLLPNWFIVSAQDGTALEKQAQGLDRMLVCPVCPGETIDQSQVRLAKQMQVIVREKLEAGETEKEILEFFIERYGENVLTAPRKQGFNLLAWGFPPTAGFMSLLLLIIVVRAMRKNRVNSYLEGSGEREVGLENYGSLIDQELSDRSGNLRDGSKCE